MIKRKVFIIKGFSKTEDEYTEDEYYVNLYRDYFLMNAGGAFAPNEIILFSEPSLKYLNKFLKKQRLDFAIFIFLGHGGTKNGYQVFQLNSDEIIMPGQITVRCKKQIIIIESCRITVDNIPTVDLADKIPRFAKGGIVRLPLTSSQAREIYDSQIKRCENGIMVCFACSPGYEAYNFIFSKSTLQCAIDWHLDSSRHCAILPMDELFGRVWYETSMTAIEEYGVKQIPHSQGNMNFPIGVSKF